MENVMVLIIAIGILIIVFSTIGAPISAVLKSSKLPSWARFNPGTPWNIPFLDGRRWLKIILIRFGQAFIWIGLFVFWLFVHLMKSLVKTLETVKKK